MRERQRDVLTMSSGCFVLTSSTELVTASHVTHFNILTTLPLFKFARPTGIRPLVRRMSAFFIPWIYRPSSHLLPRVKLGPPLLSCIATRHVRDPYTHLWSTPQIRTSSYFYLCWLSRLYYRCSSPPCDGTLSRFPSFSKRRYFVSVCGRYIHPYAGRVGFVSPQPRHIRTIDMAVSVICSKKGGTFLVDTYTSFLRGQDRIKHRSQRGHGHN